MRCPRLCKDIIYTCLAERRPAVIGGPQLRTYCKREEHAKCPRFRLWSVRPAVLDSAFLPEVMAD